MLSVIMPAYNEEAMIPVAAETLARILDEAGIAIPYQQMDVHIKQD